MNEQPETRASLILRLQHPENVVAWQEFVDIYQPLVFRLARARGLQDADALDTTQEVLVRVARAINQWDPDPSLGTFRGWISRITRNLVIEFLRSKNRLPKTSDESAIERLIEQTPARCQASELYDLEHERQVFVWASEKVRGHFQQPTWQAFWLTAVQQQSVERVAAELNLSVGAVYIARSRVLARLKQTVLQYVSAETIELPVAVKMPRSSNRSTP